MASEIVAKVKLAIRRSHSKLDDDIQADIDACIADLRVTAGIIDPDPADPLIFNAIKLFCRSTCTDDPVKSEKYHARYESLKGSLQMAEGYGWKPANEEAADE